MTTDFDFLCAQNTWHYPRRSTILHSVLLGQSRKQILVNVL